MIQVRVKHAEDQPWIEVLLQERWSGTVVVIHGTRFDAARLPALIAGDREGLATYQKRDRVTAELITLDARSPHKGVGTALIEALSALLAGEGMRRLFVTTTNDNLDALRFYQRRGFRLAALRPGAVDEARKLKPAIPPIGYHSIALRDELELVRELGR
jgi:GNAT superfamily N-acetyltransferase